MTDRKFRLARMWSNRELRKIANFFRGDIVNISAWDDRDKEGGYYKNYFKSAAQYYHTNYSGENGISNLENEFYCDLTKDLSEELINRFDVAFNHTTLEHIFDVRKAFCNICKMSKDVVIIVVPFCQVMHETKDWKDYWRFTPNSLRELFKENKLEVIYESASEQKNSAIYLFYVGSKNPQKWGNMISNSRKNRLTKCGKWIGQSRSEKIKLLIKRWLEIYAKSKK